MNLKLLLTVALSTAALAAHADVQLYGSINLPTYVYTETVAMEGAHRYE